MKKLTYFVIASLMAATVAYAETNPPSVYIIGTGGTITGNAETATSSNYHIGKLNPDQLIKDIPEIKKLANVKVIDLFQIDSGDITIQNWLVLAKNINELLAHSDTKGIVIAHGTDTLEETAYFLDLVVKNKKPIVLVGAMRPATSLSADGPINLYNAIAVASSPSSIGKGVLVVMNDDIFDGRDVTKANTTRADAFKSPNSGPIGEVNFGVVQFSKTQLKKNTLDTPFDTTKLETLPKVDIIYEYAGTDGQLLKAAMMNGAKGIVIAGTGDGNIAEPERNLLKEARAKGIVIVRSSRTGSGAVTYNYVHQLDSELGLIPADNLNPQKARILLMLALTKTDHPEAIRKYFEMY